LVNCEHVIATQISIIEVASNPRGRALSTFSPVYLASDDHPTAQNKIKTHDGANHPNKSQRIVTCVRIDCIADYLSENFDRKRLSFSQYILSLPQTPSLAS
jgi:hypothetical protein